MSNIHSKLRKAVSTGVIALCCGLLVSMSKAWSQDVPDAVTASPNIYHVVAENELMRVLLAIWQPGDRDDWHSHPPTAVFYITDCHVRAFFPDGSQRDLQRVGQTGRARNRHVISHSIQNIGDKECRILLTEIKEY